MPSLFFSYSHQDENLRDQLEIHLAGLKHQKIITTWHDRRITAGAEFATSIDANLNSADIILLLVSPHFIASEYCYAIEMQQAMARHERNEARVIPVILRPCDWRETPFGKLLGTPKDGKPITTWPDIDEAFQDVVRAIKAAVKELGLNEAKPTVLPDLNGSASPVASIVVNRSSNLRIRKHFTEFDLDQFRRDGFEFLAKFFEQSLLELVNRHPNLKQVFQKIDAEHFLAAVYVDGEKVCKGSASLSGGIFGRGAIQYSMTDDSRYGGMNEAIFVKADDQKIYFEPLGMQSYGREKEKLSFQGAAEFFWDLFIKPLQ